MRNAIPSALALLIVSSSLTAEAQDVRVDTRTSTSTTVIVTSPDRAPERRRAAPPNYAPAPTPAPPAMQEPIAGPMGNVAPPPQQTMPQAAPIRPPVPCKKTVEVSDDNIRIKVVNNYCAARVLNLKTWRDGGKTHLQFDVDNSNGGAQAHLRMVEQWSDLRGRMIGDAIDEQRIAIEAKRNKTVILSGPTPAAMTATVTLYK